MPPKPKRKVHVSRLENQFRAFRRLARRGGIKRISSAIYSEIATRLKGFVTDILKDAIEYTTHARRKTITAMDVIYALKRNGHALYGIVTEDSHSTSTHRQRKTHKQNLKQKAKEIEQEEEENKEQVIEDEKQKDENKAVDESEILVLDHPRAKSLEIKRDMNDLSMAQSVFVKETLNDLRFVYGFPEPLPGANRYIFPRQFPFQVAQRPRFYLDRQQIAKTQYHLDMFLQEMADGNMQLVFESLTVTLPSSNARSYSSRY